MQEPDVGAHFEDLVSVLAAARRLGDYESAEVDRALAAGVAAARAAGLPPERLLAGLKRLLREAPLVEVGESYRGALIDRLVLHAIEAYYAAGGTEPGGG